jgi:hypothetical protein
MKQDQLSDYPEIEKALKILEIIPENIKFFRTANKSIFDYIEFANRATIDLYDRMAHDSSRFITMNHDLPEDIFTEVCEVLQNTQFHVLDEDVWHGYKFSYGWLGNVSKKQNDETRETYVERLFRDEMNRIQKEIENTGVHIFINGGFQLW